MELDRSIPVALKAAQTDSLRDFPTFGFALSAFPDHHWSALSPSAALRRWRLLEIGAGPSLSNNRLNIDERILHYLVGIDYVDERLRGLITEPGEPMELVPSHQDIAQELTEQWRPVGDESGFEAIQLIGSDNAAKRSIAQSACAKCGLGLMLMSAHVIPSDPREFEAAICLLQRESALGRWALLVEADSMRAEDSEGMRRVLNWVDNHAGPILVSCRDPLSRPHHPLRALEIGNATGEEQRALWNRELASYTSQLNGQISELVAQFDLSVPAIQSACAKWRRVSLPENDDGYKAPEDGSNQMLGVLWDACRNHSRTSMDDLAQRIVSNVSWEDLVLPEEQTGLLHDCMAHVRHRYRVYQEWGFGRKSDRGLGITALFHGVSGTGKTLAAEIIARRLNLDLYRIDLSSVVSRYIGETEANLRRVFDAAEEGGAVLLFDEADALYGKRSEVRDSHDRHANIEVSYLLQRMEAYRGLAILTTNMKEALDEAFLRRIRFMVAFPFPNEMHREAIWRRVFPESTPLAKLDFKKVAQLSLTGGSIRNMAMHAAFMAADEGESVRMRHLLQAARIEYSKLERPMSGIETDSWV